MKKEMRNLVYVHMNESHQYVLTYGIEFSEFTIPLRNQLNHLLLLKHRFNDGDFDMHTLLDYVPNERIEKLIEDDVDNYGDFCWIDFEDVDNLVEISDQELAELLYLGHRKDLWKAPFYQILGNRFVYLSNGDGWWNKVYYRNLLDFYRMFGDVVAQRCIKLNNAGSFLSFRRKKTFPPVQMEVLLELKKMFKEGMVLSFKDIYKSRGTLEIPIWVIGDFDRMDDVYEEYEKLAKGNADKTLIFDKKTKEWKI